MNAKMDALLGLLYYDTRVLSALFLSTSFVAAIFALRLFRYPSCTPVSFIFSRSEYQACRVR